MNIAFLFQRQVGFRDKKILWGSWHAGELKEGSANFLTFPNFPNQREMDELTSNMRTTLFDKSKHHLEHLVLLYKSVWDVCLNFFMALSCGGGFQLAALPVKFFST